MITAECRPRNRRAQCLNKGTLRSAAELRDNSVENSAQCNQRHRAEYSLGQNVPGDRFVLEFAIEDLVPEKECVEAHEQNDYYSKAF